MCRFGKAMTPATLLSESAARSGSHLRPCVPESELLAFALHDRPPSAFVSHLALFYRQVCGSSVGRGRARSAEPQLGFHIRRAAL
eukprot:4459208-Prymnesium_polylepis.1